MPAKTIILAAALAVGLLSAAFGDARAASLAVTVEAGGQPLAAAVVALESSDGRPVRPPAGAHLTGIMDQRDMQFVPHILAVEVGTAVSFPNSDNIRHDVYSFSPAKTFELPLYAGTPARPVIFDKPGVVVLGCNIHDWMLAFIDVVPTPYFAQTDAAGQAVLADVPAGHYTLTIWAPRLGAPNHTLTVPVALAADSRIKRHFTVALAPAPAHVHRRPDSQLPPAVKRLQQKFHRFSQEPPP
ncbi:MAG TPA: methylamine utilization protein [Gammaproteobacteria bacterium]|nr:methylamine utilization protein [Gammaproteobacteria bacterium]